MLLRSSSTPILGSLLSPYQEGGPNNHETTNITTLKHHVPPLSPPTTIHNSHIYKKHSAVAFNIPTVSCNSSPTPSVVADHKGIRRVLSEGNLQGLAYAPCKDDEDFRNTNQPSNKKFYGRNKCSMLESIPSFSYSNLGVWRDDDDESDWDDEEYLDENDKEMLQGNRRGGEGFMAMECGGFSFNNEMASTVLSEEMKVMETLWNVGFEGERGMAGHEMYLAKGLGIGGRGGSRGGRGGGGGGDFNSTGSGGDDADSQKVEEFYKKMVAENPGNPLFLRNYGQFLYQSKKDLPKAEEYYSRAILADPGDGEILSQYAKLVWELHGDEDRAGTYHERAVHASPEDSHVHASYASFLWETEEDEDAEHAECNTPSDFNSMNRQIISQAVVASANA